MKTKNREPKISYAKRPHFKGGWYAVELTDGVETWRSSNYSDIELCEERITQRKELKAKSLARKAKLRPRCEIKPLYNKGNIVSMRIKKSYLRFIERFREYSELRAKQTDSERIKLFSLRMIYENFGLCPTAVKTMVERGEMQRPVQDNSSARRDIWHFSFEQLGALAEWFETQIKLSEAENV